MSRQANAHEKILFDIIREFNNVFYYSVVSRVIDNDQYKISVKKQKEEMVGKAYVSIPNGKNLDYEIRYNRIVNISEGYALLVPGIKAG